MLEKLRAKPDHIKKSTSLILTIVIFSGILFVWLSSWDARNRGGETRDKTLSPVASFGEVFRGVISDVQDSISGAPSYVESRRGITASTTSSTSTNNFDMSGVVIIGDQKTSSSSMAQ